MNTPQETNNQNSEVGTDENGAVRLSPEDRVRMERLREEVASRLMEMSLIVARTLGQKPLNISFDEDLPPFKFRAPEGGGTNLVIGQICGCYDYEEGVCYVCPC